MKSSHNTTQGVIGLVFNTDGVSPFKSSPFTIWPIFLSLNNLPPQLQMLKNNIITCMIWVAKSKPPMQRFLSYFKEIIQNINLTKLSVNTKDDNKTFYVKPLYGVFDMIAKAPILNMNQFNGKYGCPSCFHPGKNFERTQTYPPSTLNYPLRTTTLIQSDGKKADKDGTIINGIKGSTILGSIVDLALGSPVDYMHCVLEGVVKRLLEKWITSPRTPYYLNKHKIERITHQRPPHDFTRAPRSIQRHRKFWKASEYRTWVLFYSLPLLLGYLPPLYIHHFSLLVCAMHILLQPKLSPTQISAAETMLNDFVGFLPELYNAKECIMNSHLLLHLCQHARKRGPLWQFSAFGFEHKNGYLMGHIHSPYKVADQLIFSLNLNQTLDCVQECLLTTEPESVLSFLNISVSQSNKQGHVLYPGCYALGNMYSCTLKEDLTNKVQLLLGSCVHEVRGFCQVYYQGTIFHSLKYGRFDSKRNSTICSFIHKVWQY